MQLKQTTSNSLTKQFLQLASDAYGWVQLSNGIGGFLLPK
jgi:hypothetical protein